MEQHNDAAVDVGGSNIAIIDGSDNEPPRGGAGGTEAMSVMKTTSMTNAGKSQEGIYHGGPSKTHLGDPAGSSVSSGQVALKWHAGSK